MTFGEKLELLRIKVGLNKKQLAEKIDVTPDTAGIYTRKDTVEGIDSIRLKKIADVFDVPMDYFTSDIDTSFIDVDGDDLHYLNNDIDEIDYIKLISEIKYIIENCKLIYDGSEIEEESKKYLIDSLDIGFKLFFKNCNNTIK